MGVVSCHLDLGITTPSWDVTQRTRHGSQHDVGRGLLKVVLICLLHDLIPTQEFAVPRTLTSFPSLSFLHRAFQLLLAIVGTTGETRSQVMSRLSTSVAFKTIDPFSLIVGILCPSGNWMNELFSPNTTRTPLPVSR